MSIDHSSNGWFQYGLRAPEIGGHRLRVCHLHIRRNKLRPNKRPPRPPGAKPEMGQKCGQKPWKWWTNHGKTIGKHEKNTIPPKPPNVSWWRSSYHELKMLLDLGKFDHDQTLFSRALESWLIRGIIPKWPYFSLANYCNWPRFMMI